jgi:hypothetical protein
MLTHLQPAVGLMPTAVAAGAVATLRQLARGPFSTALLYQQQLGSWLGGSQRGHHAEASVKDAESKAPEKLKQHIKVGTAGHASQSRAYDACSMHVSHIT